MSVPIIVPSTEIWLNMEEGEMQKGDSMSDIKRNKKKIRITKTEQSHLQFLFAILFWQAPPLGFSGSLKAWNYFVQAMTGVFLFFILRPPVSTTTHHK